MCWRSTTQTRTESLGEMRGTSGSPRHSPILCMLVAALLSAALIPSTSLDSTRRCCLPCLAPALLARALLTSSNGTCAPSPLSCCSFDEFVRMAQDNIFLSGKLQEYRNAFRCAMLPLDASVPASSRASSARGWCGRYGGGGGWMLLAAAAAPHALRARPPPPPPPPPHGWLQGCGRRRQRHGLRHGALPAV